MTSRLGDQVKELTGGVHYSFGQYRIQPAGDVEFKTKNKRPKAPKVGGDLVVTSANVLNYWTTLGGGMIDTLMNDLTHTPVFTLVAALNAAGDEDDWGYMDRYFTPDQFRASDHDPVVIGLDLDNDHDDGHGNGHGKDKKKDKKHDDD